MLEINIDTFQGPLDTLYQQLKKNKISIYTIDIEKITDYYINYLEDLKIDDLSRFVLLMAEIIGIKSKMLLYYKEEEPAEELKEKLESYQIFIDIAQKFKEREIREIYYRKNSEKEKPCLEIKTTPAEICRIFSGIIKRYKPPATLATLPMEKEDFSLEEKMTYLKELITSQKINFNRILAQFSNPLEKIVLFLALIELIRLKKAVAFQDYNFGEIIVQSCTQTMTI